MASPRSAATRFRSRLPRSRPTPRIRTLRATSRRPSPSSIHRRPAPPTLPRPKTSTKTRCPTSTPPAPSPPSRSSTRATAPTSRNSRSSKSRHRRRRGPCNRLRIFLAKRIRCRFDPSALPKSANDASLNRNNREAVMPAIDIFCRQIRSRSREHQHAMCLMSKAGLAGQMGAILRQELDSMVRVIYLLAQTPDHRASLIDSAVSGKKWFQKKSKGAVTDKEMVELAKQLQGWTLSVYKFGCAFINLSAIHDCDDRDPLRQLPVHQRNDIIQHCRHYHGGPFLKRSEIYRPRSLFSPRVRKNFSKLGVLYQQLGKRGFAEDAVKSC